MLVFGATWPDLPTHLLPGDVPFAALAGGLLAALVGIWACRPRRSRRPRRLGIEVEDLEQLPRVFSSPKKFQRASRVSRRSIARWQKDYARQRKLRSLSDIALLEMGVDVLSGLVATNMKGTSFTPSLDDEEQMHESLTYLLAETKLRAIGLQDMVEKRRKQIRKSALRLSRLKVGTRAR